MYTVVGGTRIRKAVKRECKNCFKVLYVPESDTKRGRGSFCGSSCAKNYQIKVIFTSCLHCGSPVPTANRLATAYRHKYCSTKCRILDYHEHYDGSRKKGARHYSARKVAFYTRKSSCIVPWCRSKQLHIHHLNHDNADNRRRNLLAVCKHHHEKYHLLVRRLRLSH